jgi:poly(A) polymerase Pap1
MSASLGVAVFNYVQLCQIVDSLATSIDSMPQASVGFFLGSYHVIIHGITENIDTYTMQSLHLHRQNFHDVFYAMQQQKFVVDQLANQCLNVGQEIANQG